MPMMPPFLIAADAYIFPPPPLMISLFARELSRHDISMLISLRFRR